MKDLVKAIMGQDPVEHHWPLALGPQGVTDALWGMAVLGDRVAFMEETDSILKAGHILPYLSDASSLLHMLLALSVHGAELQALWQEVCFSNSQRGKAFSKGQLVDVIWSLAKATHWTPDLAAATARLSSMGGLRSLQPFQVATLLWALATLSYAPVALLSTALPQLSGGCPFGRCRQLVQASGCWLTRVCSVGGALKPSGLSMICWSLCVLQQCNTPSFTEAWGELADQWNRGKVELTTQSSGQVYQVTCVPLF